MYGGGLGGWGVGGWLEIKNKKLGFIIIYIRVGLILLLFTYVNLYLLVLSFILSFYMGAIRGWMFVYKVLTLSGCTRIFGVPRHSSGKGARPGEPGRDRDVLASTT